ncbi:hypothetical protein ACFTAO_27405 [Paenibacillus rhizoplanae]
MKNVNGPDFSGRIIAWRGEGINIALEYEYSGEGRVLRTYTACLIGCIGAWRSDNPEVFLHLEQGVDSGRDKLLIELQGLAGQEA